MPQCLRQVIVDALYSGVGVVMCFRSQRFKIWLLISAIMYYFVFCVYILLGVKRQKQNILFKENLEESH